MCSVAFLSVSHVSNVALSVTFSLINSAPLLGLFCEQVRSCFCYQIQYIELWCLDMLRMELCYLWMELVLFSQGLCCCSSSLWLNREGPAAVWENVPSGSVFFFLFFSSGPCHLPKTHCEEQCQEEEDVRVFHRVCALTQVTGGEFSGSGLSRLSAAETVYVPLQSGFGSIRSQPSHPTT